MSKHLCFKCHYLPTFRTVGHLEAVKKQGKVNKQAKGKKTKKA